MTSGRDHGMGLTKKTIRSHCHDLRMHLGIRFHVVEEYGWSGLDEKKEDLEKISER
jgi:hypothetical protein